MRVLRFELGTLRELGHLPSLEACADCGREVALTGRMAFGQLHGGVLCNRCRAGKRQVATVGAGAIRAMVEMAAEDRQSWQRLEIDARTQGELRGVLNHYLANLMGHRPRLHSYLGILGS